MRDPVLKTAVVALAVLFAAACGNTPVAPSPTQLHHAAAPVPTLGTREVGTWFLCYTSIRSPDGPDRYRYGHLELHFPRKALAPDGSTLLYRFRAQREGRDPDVVANCVIPRTEEAIELVSRRFHVDRNAIATEPGGDPVVVQGCVTGGTCELETLVAVADGCANPEWTEGEDGVCRSARGGMSGGSTGGYWWETTGGGGDSPDPGDPAACEEDCAIEESDSDICPQPLSGRTLAYGATIASRLHTFKFSGTMRRDGVGRSPAWYTISRPTASEDTWWIAESGKIQVVCYGRWISRYLWIGQLFVINDDLHFVMGPGHPDF